MQRLKNEHVKLQRIIKFVRPTDLPPLITPGTSTAAPHTDTKKKLTLPLFGKKGKFSFRSTIVPSIKKPKLESEIEFEIEEDSPDEEQEKDLSHKAKDLSHEAKDVSPPATSTEAGAGKSSDLERLEDKKHPDKPEEKVKETVEIESDEETVDTEEQEDNADQIQTSPLNLSSSSSKKKKRSRNRNRSDKKHERTDYDDTGEVTDSTKYSGWVPPVDQSGDGITDLNSKYGY